MQPLQARAPWREHFAAVAGLAALSLLLFSQVLFTDRTYYYGDILLSFYPHQHLWAEAVRQGEVPLWNPYAAGGRPWLADASFSPLYPTMLLNLVMPTLRALSLDLALHVWAAAVFTYFFLLRWGLPRTAAFLGAVVFGFGGFVVAHIPHPSLIRSLAWTPLILLSVMRIPYRPWADAVPRLGGAFALSILAGHLQVVLITALLSVLLAAYLAATSAKGLAHRLLAAGRALAILGTGASLGGLAGAVVLLPALELGLLSVRAEGLAFEAATSFSLPRRQLLMLVLPDLYGNPFKGGYVGSPFYWEATGTVGTTALLLAAIGVCCGRYRGRWFFATVTVVAVVLAAGRNTPLYAWLLAIFPPLVFFRVPARFLVWSSFALAVLAAHGIEWLAGKRIAGEKRHKLRLTTMSLLFIAGAGVYAAIPGPAIPRLVQVAQAPLVQQWEPRQSVAPMAAAAALADVRRAGLFVSAASLLILALISRSPKRNLAVGGLAALLLAEVLFLGMTFYPTAEMTTLSPVRPALDLDEGAFRIATARRFKEQVWGQYVSVLSARTTPAEVRAFRQTLSPSMGMLEGMADVTTYNSIQLQHVEDFAKWMWRDFEERGGRSPLLDFSGARFILDRGPLRWYQAQAEDPPVWFNPNAMPRGWLVTQFEVVADRSEMERLLTGSSENAAMQQPFDPRQTVLLYEAPTETYGLTERQDAGRIVRREYYLNRVEFELQPEGPVILVLNDTHYPGWRATADGREVPIYRANHAFRAVFLPETARRVVFTFRPVSVLIGLALSILGLACIGVLMRKSHVTAGSLPSGRLHQKNDRALSD